MSIIISIFYQIDSERYMIDAKELLYGNQKMKITLIIFKDIQIAKSIIIINKKEMGNLGNNLTTLQAVVNYQTKRLGKPPGTYTAEQLGLGNIISKGNNLYDLVSNGRLKLLDCIALSKDEVKFTIYNPSFQIMAKITGGTLLTPHQTQNNRQTLLIRKDQELKLGNGLSEHLVKTFCHDLDRPAPQNQNFVLASVKNLHYKSGMDQNQV